MSFGSVVSLFVHLVICEGVLMISKKLIGDSEHINDSACTLNLHFASLVAKKKGLCTMQAL